MSTGLTYVNITDTDQGTNPSVTGSYVFSSYEEAYNFGDWYCRWLQNVYGSSNRNVYVAIYTTTPNPNGYWPADTTPTAFVPFD